MKSIFAGALLLAITLFDAHTSVAETVPFVPQGMEVFLKNGGWCWFQEPRAVISRDKLVVGAVAVHPRGEVKAAVYDLAERQPLGSVVLKTDFQPDDHNAPAFHLRDDGSLLAVYAAHGTEDRHYYRISDSSDYLRWGPEQVTTHPGARITYMNLFDIPTEKTLYCFYRRTEYRDGIQALFNPFFMASADDGSTWNEGRLLIADGVAGVQRPYVRYWGDGKAVHLLFTEAHPRDYNNSIYYARFRGEAFYRADGTCIKGLKDGGPLMPAEAECIYEGGESNVAWCSSIVTDSKGRPHAAFSTRRSKADHRFHRALWDGASWQVNEVAFAGSGLYDAELDYTGLISLDPTEPTVAYISSDVEPGSGQPTNTHEIYTANLPQGVSRAEVNWRVITRDSPYRNLRPVCVAGGGHKVLLWLRGPWRTYTDYDCDVVGVVLE